MILSGTNPLENTYKIPQTLLNLFRLLNHTLEDLKTRNDTFIKGDASPVTIADLTVQILVNRWIREHFPADQIISEEKSDSLNDHEKLMVKEVCQQLFPAENVEMVFDDLDYCGSDQSGACWFIDPIDGTKGYLRGEQYAIAVARYDKDDACTLAFLICPNLPFPDLNGSSTGTIFFLSENGKVSQHSLQSPDLFEELPKMPKGKPAIAKSVEKSHGNSRKMEQLAQDMNLDVIEMDSQAKYGLLLRGEAGLYLRLPSEKPYFEKTWDHAAGKALLSAVNGTTTDSLGNPIQITKTRTFDHTNGVVASIGIDHNRIIQIITEH